MKNRMLFSAAALGVLAALGAAYFFGLAPKTQPPLFDPAPNPYASGIYANGIIESDQSSGSNLNIYAEVTGTVARILVKEGDSVKAGDPLVALDDSVQRAVVGQQQAQAGAALALLRELKAQPRKEALAVSRSQVDLAEANMRTARDQFAKQRQSYELNPKSISRDALDNARNAMKVAGSSLALAQRQYELTKAGAWGYDIDNQQWQYDALLKTYEAAQALLAKYTIRAPADGVVLALNAAIGGYVSPQGVYNSYTQGSLPLLVMGSAKGYLNVRCYIDEILINRLPPHDKIIAQMSVRGTSIKIPLEFVRVQPYVSPKIALADQRQERVDLRVLPVIFRFPLQDGLKVYPGQLVDVYVGQK